MSHAFNVTGDAPLFMQDFDCLESANTSSISSLLIEAPSDNALKKNTDHFIKRNREQCMSLEMAALALFTFQTVGKAVGTGYRVGLRGGGPLTTLIMPQHENATLWHKLWLNVIHREQWSYVDPDLHSAKLFPWLEKTKTSEPKSGVEIYSSDVHPLHMYWAMPSRVRLLVNENSKKCCVLGIDTLLSVGAYQTKNFGGNYCGTWDHPLTPYKFNPKKLEEDHWSEKGKKEGITYKIWDSLVMQSEIEGQIPAKVVKNFLNIHSDFTNRVSEISRLWVFGYDLKSAKVNCWYSVEMPIFSIPANKQERVLAEIKILQTLADESIKECRKHIKEAWFDRPKDAKGDLTFVDVAFWQRTEQCFFKAVAQLIASDNQRLSTDEAKQWLDELTLTITTLFDETVLSDLNADRSMAKKIKARQLLTYWIIGKGTKAFKHKNNIETVKQRKKS